MIISFLLSLTMASLAIACAFQLNFPTALIAWVALAAGACSFGALLLSRQPVGIATVGGRFGFGWVRWGFRAGRGQLLPAAIISWLIWLVLGSAVIGSLHFREHLPIIAAGTVDVLGLFYVVGVALANRSGRVPISLLKLASVLVLLVVGGGWLWFHADTEGARALAVAITVGPLLFVGAGYSLVLLTSLLSGRSHH